MKKLTDVLKYNKEIQKKNQGAVINQNIPVKPKQTINVFPSVNNPAPSPIEQIRTAAPKTTTPFAPVRTNVSDIREEANPVNRFNTFMQTPKGQEILQRFKDNYSYITEISSVVNNASVMGKNRKALNNEINEHERQVADFGYKFQQNKGVHSTEDAMTYDFHRTNLKIKRKDKEKMLDSVSEQIAEKYTPEQINHYISIYERNNPDDAEMINALKIAETLTYLKAEQREYNEAFEKAQSGDAETLAIIEKGKQNYKAPTNLMGVPMSGSLPEDVQNWYDEQYPEEANFKNYIFGKYDTEKAEKMWKKHLQEKSNQSLIDASKDNAVLKNVAMPVYNIGTQLLSPIYGAEMLVQNTKNMYSGKNEPVSMYSPGSAVMSAKDASAEAFTVGDSEGTAFLKNVLLSVGGNAANVALFGAATPYMMALQSGSSTAYETMKKGGTTQQAVLNGVIGGTIEYFTEKLPFEKLTETFAGAKGLKNMSKADVTKFIASRIGLQAVAEYGEETVNSYASTIADMIVMGEKSDYMQYVNELVKDGQSTEKAYEMANKKFFLTDPQMAGLSGLISGGLMSTGAVTLGTMKAASEGKGQVVTYTASDKLDKDALETLNNIAKASGVNITVEDLAPVEVTDENGNKKYMINKGETDADGTIRINSSEMGSVEDALVAYHEVTHTLENTEAYDAYRDIALNIMYGGRGTDAYNQAMSAKSSQYGDKAQGTDLLEKELVAEFTRTQLSNEGVVEKIVAENRNVATRIYNALKKAYTNIKNKLQGKETNLTDMEKAINLFEKALGENRKMSFTEALVKGNTDTRPYIDEEGNVQFGETKANEDGNKIRYSIKEIPKIGKVAFVDGKTIEQDEGEELNHAIRRYFDKNFKNKEVIIEDTVEKTKLDQIGKYLYPGQTVKNYGEKREAVTVLDEIIRIATDKKWNKNLLDESGNIKNHGGYDCTNGFNYYDTQFAVDNTGVIWGGRVVVRIDKNNNMYFYDLDNIREIGYYQDVKNINPVEYGSSTSLTDGSLSQEPPTVNTNNMQKSQNNSQESNGKQHLLGAVIEEGATTEENSVLEYNSTAKSRTRLERYENEAVRKVADAMSVRLGTAREFLKPIIQEMSNEYMKTGKLSQDTIDRLFEEAYKNGKIVNDEAYKEYADLRNYLRNTKIYFDSESAADIPDFFKDIRRYMGRLSVSSTNGTSVDSIYQELNEMHPSLFPEDILSSSDRMLRIMEVSDSLRKEEVTLDAYYNTEETKGDLKHEFEKAVYAFKDNLYEVKHFNDSLEKEQPSVEINRTDKEQVAYLKNAYSELSSARKNAEKIMGNLLITEEEKEIAEKVISGAIRPEKIKSLGLNTDAINKYIGAYGAVRTLEKEIKKENTKTKAKRIEDITRLLENSDNWKDKKVIAGIRYAAGTQERNIEDITTSPKEADAIKKAIFEPIDIHEAESNRYKNKLLDDIDKLKISQKAARGNRHSEAYAVQFLGEIQGEIEYLEEKLARYDKGEQVKQDVKNINKKKTWIDKDREKLAQLKRDADVFIDANPKLDYGKIDKCISEFRKIYNELFEMMNEARIRNGYAPVEYRKNYFPHFKKNKGDSFLNGLGRAVGFDLENKFFMSDTVTSLPTEIMGRTADRKPGIKWLANALHRSEDSITDYDAIDGFAKYVTGVCDVIFHTDDIQNVRAFSNAIRYKYSDDGVKEKIAEIGENDTLTDEEKLKQISEKLQEGYKNKLGNYAVNLDKYANVLAGKQVGFLDRVVEDNFGRNTLRAWSRFQGKVGANMIVGNAKTPFMNFATIPQARKELSHADLAYGIFHTLKNIKTPDGFDDKSTFLTNRVKIGNPDRIKTMTKPKHFLDAIGKPLEFTDALTSGLIWRGRYHQNIVKRNMPSEEAIREADAYTKKLIGGRSYGSMPTLFYSKSGKVITQYMLETNNLISNITKDLSRYAKKDSKGVAEAIVRASWRFIKYSLAAELLADLFEKWFGNDGIQSPLGIVLDGIDDFTKLRVPNAFDAIEMLIEEGALDFEDEAKDPAVAIGNTAVNVLEDLPFTSIITDGRIPASAGMYDVTELVKIFSDPEKVSNKKKMDIILNEFVVPLSYRTLPAGAGQLKKTVEGINAYQKGGSYKINNEGEEELQYPIEKDAGYLFKTALWGKSSTKGSRDWVEEGFGSLTAEQTDLYQRIIEDKKTSRTDVYNAISNARKAESVKDGDKSRTETQVRHEIVSKAKGLSWKQKYMIEYSFMSDDNKEKIKAMTNNGVSQDTAYRVLYEYADSKEVSKEAKYKKYYNMSDGGTSVVAEKWGYETELSVIKREALAHDGKLTAEEKQTINTALFGESETEYDFSNVDNYYYSTLSKNQKKGYDQYIRLYGKNSMNARTFYYAIKVMNSTKDGNGSKKVAKVTRLRKAGFTLAQANRIYNILN